MSSRTTIIGLAIVAILATTLALKFRQGRRLDQDLARVTGATSRLSERIAASESRVRELEATLAAIGGPPVPSAGIPRPESAANPAGPGLSAGAGRGAQAVPGFKTDSAPMNPRAAGFVRLIAPFANARGLTAAQVDRLADIQTEDSVLGTAVFTKAEEIRRTTGTIVSNAELIRQSQEIRDATEAKVKAELGDDGYAALNDFRATAAYRSAIVLQFQPHAVMDDTMLTPAQLDRLAQVAFATKAANNANGLRFPPEALEKVSSFVTPGQLAVIRRISQLHAGLQKLADESNGGQ